MNRGAVRTAAADEPAARARPFIKWVGGKTQLLPELRKRVPAKFGTYYEPFLGGGALFFDLAPERAVLCDSNLRLVETYRGIRSDVEQVIELLGEHEKAHRADPAGHYYKTREAPPHPSNWSGLTAAWFIYLNRTCYNGLYRVNRRNEFNVPMGRYANPTICDAENLRACADALKTDVEIHRNDFQTIAQQARPGDFVYFDSPYAPLSKTADFVSYTADRFALQDQIRLRDLALRLKDAGVHVLLSNACTPFVEDLYNKHFTLECITARRAINSKAGRRGPISEYVIR